MKERLEEIRYKYDKKIESEQKTMRIDTDDYLELLGMAEIAALEEESE